MLLFGAGLYSEKTKGRGGGAIIALGFEYVQVTVGTTLHTMGMVGGDDYGENGWDIGKIFEAALGWPLEVI